jgi:hypothetical protein
VLRGSQELHARFFFADPKPSGFRFSAGLSLLLLAAGRPL